MSVAYAELTSSELVQYSFVMYTYTHISFIAKGSQGNQDIGFISEITYVYNRNDNPRYFPLICARNIEIIRKASKSTCT